MDDDRFEVRNDDGRYVRLYGWELFRLISFVTVSSLHLSKAIGALAVDDREGALVSNDAAGREIDKLLEFLDGISTERLPE